MPKAKFDPYAELGVGRNADAAEIKTAFRRKAKAAHPDRGGAKGAFETVKKAHLVLSDPVRRKSYDETGSYEDGPKESIADQAHTVLSGLISALLDGEQDPNASPLVDVMIDYIDDQIAEILRAKNPLAGKIAKAKRMAKKFKRKAKRPGDNLLARMTQWKVEAMTAKVEQMDKTILVMRTAKDILNDYGFEADARPLTEADLIMSQFRERGKM